MAMLTKKSEVRILSDEPNLSAASSLAFWLTASDDVIDGARSDDDLRNEAIRAGVGGVADKVNSSVENLLLADQLGQRVALRAEQRCCAISLSESKAVNAL
jgi:hypothetical protein